MENPNLTIVGSSISGKGLIANKSTEVGEKIALIEGRVYTWDEDDLHNVEPDFIHSEHR